MPQPVLQADGVAAVHHVLGGSRVAKQMGMQPRYARSLRHIPHHLLNSPECQGASFLAQKEPRHRHVFRVSLAHESAVSAHCLVGPASHPAAHGEGLAPILY
jgi:hypothetical protein